MKIKASLYVVMCLGQLKKWQVRDDALFDEKRNDIQTKQRKDMAILVDIPMTRSGATKNSNFIHQPKLALSN